MSARENLAALIDVPAVIRGTGGLSIVREKRSGLRETEWTRSLMGSYAGWHDLVGIGPARSIELEVPLCPPGLRFDADGQSSARTHIRGLCRADAIIHHDDGSVTILEAKVTSSPTDICQAIGQLIYYKTLVEIYWDAPVAALICAARHLPPFVLETIAKIQAPVRFLKATDDNNYYGLVPSYETAS